MQKASPTVSIGLPVRNGLPFLREAIESLLSQTFRDFELILSDNASEDGTAAACAEYARRDPRVRLLQNSENLGAAENHNQVVRAARGRYFKWASADDVCLPSFLERCLEVLETRPAVVLCYPKTQFVDENNSRNSRYEDNMHLAHPSAVRRLRHVLRALCRANCVFGVIRAEVLRQTNLMGTYPSADTVLLAELAMLGHFHEVPETLFLRRIHKEQSMQAYKTERERARWFHPRRAGGRLFPSWRLLGEHGRAIHRLPLSFRTRLGCYLQLIHLLRRRRKSLVREITSLWPLLARHNSCWVLEGELQENYLGKSFAEK